MSGKVLMRLSGNQLLTNSWVQELVITEDAVYGEILKNFKRVKMSLPFDRIAQVNLVRGVLAADIELVNKGGSDNLIIRALNKQQAEQAKALIEQKMRTTSAHNPQQSPQSLSLADELKKLADLKANGIITEEEFETLKKQTMSKGV